MSRKWCAGLTLSNQPTLFALEDVVQVVEVGDNKVSVILRDRMDPVIVTASLDEMRSRLVEADEAE